MKKITIAMLAFVMLLASCSKGPKTASYIPNDAMVVVNLNVKQLLDKADAKNIDNISFVKLARQELRNENAQLSEILDDIIADPTSTGLDLREDILYFLNKDGDGALVISMHKESKFENFINDLATKNDISCDISKGDGYNNAELEVITIPFNKEVAIIPIKVDNPEKFADNIFNIDKDNTLAKSKNFNAHWKEHSEIGFWMDMNNLLTLVEEFESIEELGLPKDYVDGLRKSSFACNLVFDKGAIRFVTTMQGISDKLLKDYMQDFNSDLIKCMPEKCLAAFAFATPMERMVDMLANTGTLDVDEPLANGMSYRDMAHALGGSFLLSLFDITTNENGIKPLLACAADIKDSKLVREILENSGFEKKGDMYVIPDFGIGEVMLCINDKAFLMTNSDEAASQFSAGSNKNGLKAIASNVKKGNYLYADLNLTHYPASVTDLIPDNLVQLLINYLDYTEAKILNDTKGEWAIYINEKKENSLLATLHFVDNNLMALANLAESLGGSSDIYDESEDENEYYIDDDAYID